MITAAGSVDAFYARFYINSVCPLGFTIEKGSGRAVNYNYYDDPALFIAVKPFMLKCIRRQIDLGCFTEECFCMGVKNGEYLKRLNEEAGFFGKVTVLPHPRFIMQYRRKHLEEAISAYTTALLEGLVTFCYNIHVSTALFSL